MRARIAWTHISSGHTGHGEYMEGAKAEAQVNSLNKTVILYRDGVGVIMPEGTEPEYRYKAEFEG